MSSQWRSDLVERALAAFAEDLDYAVALVSTSERKPARAIPRSTLMPCRRVAWGAPPQFVAYDPSEPLGR